MSHEHSGCCSHSPSHSHHSHLSSSPHDDHKNEAPSRELTDEELEPYLILLPQDVRSLSPSEQADHFRSMLSPQIKKLPIPSQISYLEHALEHLKGSANDEDAIRQQQQYREELQQKYVPLHKDLYSLDNWKFCDSFTNAIRIGTEDAIMEILNEEISGVYTFDMLPPEFCTKLLEEIHHFEKWCEENTTTIHRPNSMNRYGCILDDFGFTNALNDLTKRYFNPLSKVLYPHVGDTLDSHHAFVVEYEMGKDEKLDFHVDDSEVTVNVCLGTEFKGGELFFGGVRCPHHQTTGTLPGESYDLGHTVGQGIIHVGPHRHLAKPITDGHRLNLIIWNRSSSFREASDPSDCPEWCGVHHMKHLDPRFANKKSSQK